MGTFLLISFNINVRQCLRKLTRIHLPHFIHHILENWFWYFQRHWIFFFSPWKFLTAFVLFRKVFSGNFERLKNALISFEKNILICKNFWILKEFVVLCAEEENILKAFLLVLFIRFRLCRIFLWFVELILRNKFFLGGINFSEIRWKMSKFYGEKGS